MAQTQINASSPVVWRGGDLATGGRSGAPQVDFGGQGAKDGAKSPWARALSLPLLSFPLLHNPLQELGPSRRRNGVREPAIRSSGV